MRQQMNEQASKLMNAWRVRTNQVSNPGGDRCFMSDDVLLAAWHAIVGEPRTAGDMGPCLPVDLFDAGRGRR